MAVKWLSLQAQAKSDPWLSDVADFRILASLRRRFSLLNWELIDRFWRLSIPIGETMDHPLVNPFGPVSPNLESKDLDSILVVVGGSDLLRNRAEDYARKLKGWGKKVEYVEFEGKQHGFFTVDPNSPDSDQLMLIIKWFIIEN
ncbi:putative carboxylesterase 15 [Camellia lanceoleosa]|uniref:Carboxylesterase 15 n=1 Tax=Camellia lanceoleosa TaxID=1840588 RepID=A0ACC0FVG5_9ERIC|nr:putative carboxylesterase 15 [Camellia lanceoleosa]